MFLTVWDNVDWYESSSIDSACRARRCEVLSTTIVRMFDNDESEACKKRFPTKVITCVGDHIAVYGARETLDELKSKLNGYYRPPVRQLVSPAMKFGNAVGTNAKQLSIDLERRYVCERCGGTGHQPAGCWDGYAAPAGVCDDCHGEGLLNDPAVQQDSVKQAIEEG